MENKIYEIITADMAAVFEQNSFAEENGVYVNGDKAVRLDYDEEKKLCSISAAAVSEGEIGEFAVLNSWLVDENTTANDAKSVVLDFTESFEKLIGKKKVRGAAEVKLPQKAAAGETPNVTALCQKFLAVFPQYKDAYKEHVALYGGFLPITFFKATAVPELNTLLKSGTDKQLAKMTGLLSEMFKKGDREVGNIVVGVIIAGAVAGNEELYNKFMASIDSPYLKPAVQFIFPRSTKGALKKVLE